MTATWGPVEKPAGRAHRATGEEGDVTLSAPSRFEGSPRHDVRYDAADSRHNPEAGLRPWESVDDNSGTANDTDWGLTGRFPDGPGAWRQT